MERPRYLIDTNAIIDYLSRNLHSDGIVLIREAYGRSGIIVANIDLNQATGLLAERFKKELYADRVSI